MFNCLPQCCFILEVRIETYNTRGTHTHTHTHTCTHAHAQTQDDTAGRGVTLFKSLYSLG